MMNRKDIYKKIIDYFMDKPVERISVFGSFSRKENNRKSDIDILLALRKPVGLIALSGYKIDLEKILGIPVDLGTEKGISDFVLPYIQKEMKVIYEKR